MVASSGFTPMLRSVSDMVSRISLNMPDPAVEGRVEQVVEGRDRAGR